MKVAFMAPPCSLPLAFRPSRLSIAARLQSISSQVIHCSTRWRLAGPVVSQGPLYREYSQLRTFHQQVSVLRGNNAAPKSLPGKIRLFVTATHGESVTLSDDRLEEVKEKVPERGQTIPDQDSRGPQQRQGRQPIRKGQEIELVCDSLAFKGMGVCRIAESNFVVLCERALPGERLIAKITKNKRTFAEAYKVATLEPHADAVEPRCDHFPHCGGCKLQNLGYQAQLSVKEQQVSDLIQRTGRFGEPGGAVETHEAPGAVQPAPVAGAGGEGTEGHMRPIIGCELEYHYRNKMEFSFSSRVWSPEKPPPREIPSVVEEGTGGQEEVGEAGREVAAGGGGAAAEDADGLSAPGRGSGKRGKRGGRDGGAASSNPRQFALGLHAPKRFDKILPIHTCHLQHPVANEILQFVREYCEARQEEMPPYDAVTKEGFLRHLTIRTARQSEPDHMQIMVALTTKEDKPDLLRPLAQQIASKFPQVVSIVNGVNETLSDVAQGSRENLLHGVPTITERLRGLDFEISASSFFQTNTTQAEVLYATVEGVCGLEDDRSQVLLDLFCGTGTIGLSMAHRVRHVYGFELVPQAVDDARRNAERNGIRNATFIQGDLNKLGTDFGEQFPRPDVIITDPNRPGMHPKLIDFLIQCKAPRIVYVSCNPASCARDMDLLCHPQEDGTTGPYRLVSVQPVDMFPHTPHVETVSLLTLAESIDG